MGNGGCHSRLTEIKTDSRRHKALLESVLIDSFLGHLILCENFVTSSNYNLYVCVIFVIDELFLCSMVLMGGSVFILFSVYIYMFVMKCYFFIIYIILPLRIKNDKLQLD